MSSGTPLSEFPVENGESVGAAGVSAFREGLVLLAQDITPKRPVRRMRDEGVAELRDGESDQRRVERDGRPRVHDEPGGLALGAAVMNVTPVASLPRAFAEQASIRSWHRVC